MRAAPWAASGYDGPVDAQPIIGFLLDPARRDEDMTTVLDGLVAELDRAGFQVFSAAASCRTMHPEVFVEAYRHGRGEGTRHSVRDYEVIDSPSYLDSPVRLIHRGERAYRRRLSGPVEEHPYSICRELSTAGATDYLIVRLPLSGEMSTFFSVSTDLPGGFEDEHIELIDGIVPALSLLVDLASAKLATRALLDTYLGQNAGRRVMAGAFRRGRCELIEAVIWMCDLRGFTSMVDTTPREEALATLDAYFCAVSAPIMAHGGEVLKFIGDAVLAIFPVAGDGPEVQARRALAASREAVARMEEVNQKRMARGASPLAFGIALHRGEVTYGNIGAPGRLDFTVIGPAVNVASRIESLCKDEGVSVIVSGPVASACEPEQFRSLGRRTLRGVSEPIELFTLEPSDRTQGE